MIDLPYIDAHTHGGAGIYDMPCPDCGPACRAPSNQRRAVLRVWREDEDFATYKCARCGAKGFARTGVASRPTARAACSIVPRTDDVDDGGTTRARLIFEEAQDARGTIVEKFLASRKLVLPECGSYTIRFHPTCPWENRRVPAMVAAFRLVDNDNIIRGIHRTALTPDGEKIGRKMLGRVSGAAIMLDRSEDVTTSITISEGIESGLAARLLGWRPTWALGSAGAIAKFPVLNGIDCLNVAAELDDGGANARAIEEVGNRWTDAGREVLLIKPVHGGDMNDALRRCA